MEDRLGELYLEMTNLSIEAYEVERLGDVLKREDVELATLWRNQRPKREDYERTIPEFETLAVYEVAHDFAMPTDARDHRGHHFRRVPRPAQGILSGEPTVGLEIVLVSPVNPYGVQALRDWADFLHIREIASAAVPGFTMITPYENAAGGTPRFLHLYEMDTPDADQAFQHMAPHTIERLRVIRASICLSRLRRRRPAITPSRSLTTSATWGASAAKYPYREDGDNAFLEDKPFLEPFTLIPAMGAVTERLRFTTLVVKLPVRQPYLVAKQATSIAVLTDNRFGFGVGLSPWPEDFALCGADWESRGPRMDEMIEILRGLARGGFYEFKAAHYEIPPVKMCPVPSESIPILIGGHSGPALRRAARLGDGWMHAGGDGEELDRLLARLRALRAEYGREQTPFEIHVISVDASQPDGIRRLEDKGVTDVIVGFRNVYTSGPDTQSLDEKSGALRRFADTVIAKA